MLFGAYRSKQVQQFTQWLTTLIYFCNMSTLWQFVMDICSVEECSMVVNDGNPSQWYGCVTHL